jgi:hypothetical protein
MVSMLVWKFVNGAQMMLLLGGKAAALLHEHARMGQFSMGVLGSCFTPRDQRA